ncbi:MAG: ATP-dependent Clp protease ATP-binding subunit [Deltaproteobacteria bacterium]|nr:ATP-dependent Clp protease ATP-binding subunit [Deltaproteobacteria bacterium]
MALPHDESLQRVIDEAGELAARGGTPYSSGHLLLALLGREGPARQLLLDRGLSAGRLTEQLTALGADSEAGEVVTLVRDRCARLAQSCGARTVDPLHLLIVLCTLRESLGYRTLAGAGLDPASLRSAALAVATGGPHLHRRSTAARTRPPLSGTVAPPVDPESPPGDARTPEAESVAEPTPGEDATTPPRGRLRRRAEARRDPRVTRGGSGASAADPPRCLPTLDASRFPTLTALGRNLSLAAARGELEPLVGRRALVEQILDILGKRRANNPCLVGEPGVGKTALVEGLAYLQASSPEEVPFLDGRQLVELNMGALLSGTQLRGSFSERMAALRAEVEAAEGSVIVFLDEIHTLVGAGAVGEGALDAVGELSASMAQGKFPCIGATTADSFKRYIEEAPALVRRLVPVVVPEPSDEETLAILRGVAPSYARHHRVEILPEALDAAVRLSGRYITDRFLPDKAIGMLDLAGSRARRRGLKTVGRAEVAHIVAESAGMPPDRLLMTDTERFLRMEGFLRERVVGHDEVLKRVAEVIRRNYAGFATDRPIGSFLFLGPTGVGKTELVKVLADFLFQNRDALCRFDMSEFMEPHSVARLIGSPPGYVGHEEGGQLTEAVRGKPYQIVLLDEVEKAHREVLQVLLQLLDDGRLTDGRGRTVDFSHTVVVLTSNLGSELYERRRGPIGFGLSASSDTGADAEWERVTQEVLAAARRAFPIELWNRIEQRLVFQPLTRPQVLAVARLLVADSSRRLEQEKQIRFEATEAALDYLIDHGGFDPLLGARPMRTTIQRLIEGPVAEQILAGRARAGDTLRVDREGETLVVSRMLAEGGTRPEEEGGSRPA